MCCLASFTFRGKSTPLEKLPPLAAEVQIGENIANYHSAFGLYSKEIFFNNKQQGSISQYLSEGLYLSDLDATLFNSEGSLVLNSKNEIIGVRSPPVFRPESNLRFQVVHKLPQTLQKTAAKSLCLKSIVKVQTLFSTASGVVVKKFQNGFFVLTNSHAVEEKGNRVIVAGSIFNSELVYRSNTEAVDFALLLVTAPAKQEALKQIEEVIPNFEVLKNGVHCQTLGFSFFTKQEEPSLFKGRTLRYFGPTEALKHMFILSDSKLFQGGSGGAFLDENGKFIGLAFKNLITTLTNMKERAVEHYKTSFALSALYLKPFFYELSQINKAGP